MNRKDKLNLTKEQKQIYENCYKEAVKYFNLQKGWVLHHKDTNLVNNDVDRYIQWLPSDLQPMTKSEHRRLHMLLNNPMNNEESRYKISIANKGKESKNKVKVICVELNKEYSSVTEAAKELNLLGTHISRVLNGHRKTTGGYHFIYA